MQKIASLIFVCFSINAAYAEVIPTMISPDKIKSVSKKFNGLLSSNTSNSPHAVGTDFKFELTGVYQDLQLNDISEFQTVSSKHLLEPFATVKKGLYLNFDLSFSFPLPVESHITSGYTLGVSHAVKIQSTQIKSEVYISNYTLDDILNINSSGLSVVAYKKMGLAYLGLGGRLESNTGRYEEKFLNQNTLTSNGKNEASYLSGSALLKVFIEHGIYNCTLTYAFSEETKSEAALSFGFIL